VFNGEGCCKADTLVVRENVCGINVQVSEYGLQIFAAGCGGVVSRLGEGGVAAPTVIGSYDGVFRVESVEKLQLRGERTVLSQNWSNGMPWYVVSRVCCNIAYKSYRSRNVVGSHEQGVWAALNHGIGNELIHHRAGCARAPNRRNLRARLRPQQQSIEHTQGNS
jgi:hypothetical protein